MCLIRNTLKPVLLISLRGPSLPCVAEHLSTLLGDATRLVRFFFPPSSLCMARAVLWPERSRSRAVSVLAVFLGCLPGLAGALDTHTVKEPSGAPVSWSPSQMLASNLRVEIRDKKGKCLAQWFSCCLGRLRPGQEWTEFSTCLCSLLWFLSNAHPESHGSSTEALAIHVAYPA